jgi:hypothetical protein
MKLSEIFSQLTYGELSQLSLGGGEVGQISPANYPAVVAHVNMALIALYTRFPLKEGNLSFALENGRTVYPLDTNEDTRFTGTEEFLDDLIKVEKVTTDKDVTLALNDEAETYSCFTPSAGVLRVPYDIASKVSGLPAELLTDAIKVIYRASHPMIKVTGAGFNPARVNIELPYSHLEALLMYVASRVNNPVGMTNEFHAGNSYYAKYEKACQLLETKNVQVDQGSQNTRLSRGGWL